MDVKVLEQHYLKQIEVDNLSCTDIFPITSNKSNLNPTDYDLRTPFLKICVQHFSKTYKKFLKIALKPVKPLILNVTANIDMAKNIDFNFHQDNFSSYPKND